MRSIPRNEGQYPVVREGYERRVTPRTSLAAGSWDELKRRAREMGIQDVDQMSKRELMRAIRSRSEH